MSLSDLNRIERILDGMIAIKDDIDNDIKAKDNRIAAVENNIKTDLSKLEKKLEEVIDNNKAKDLKIAMIENELNETKFKIDNSTINDSCASDEMRGKIESVDKEMEEKKAKIVEMEKKLEDIISDNTDLSTQTMVSSFRLYEMNIFEES